MRYDPKCYELAKSFAEDADIKPTPYNHEDRRFVEHLMQCIQDRIEEEITDFCEQRESYIAAKRAGEDV